MYRLTTLGGLELVGGGSRRLSHQRLRLALLALLAASGTRGMSRDRIVAFLWPDSDASAGRHALEQLIHSLRRSLGDAVFTGVNPVALNGDTLPSDVAEFEEALERDDFASAVALYRGPFLNGFFLDNAGEFDRWIEAERARLAGQFVRALACIAEAEDRNGNLQVAVEWRRRLVETEPLSSRFALHYMKALVAAGDRGAALRYARVHEQLVRQELEADPDPAIVEFAATLRDSTETAARLPHRAVERDDGRVDDLERAAPEVAPDRAQTSSPERGSFRVLRAFGMTPGRMLVLAAIVAIAVVVWPWFRIATRPALDEHALVIVPFRITGADSSAAYLSEGVVDLLAPLLTSEDGLRAVDSRTAISAWKSATRGSDGSADDARRVARALGARQALFGSVVVAPTELTISANLLDADGGERQPAIRVSAPLDSIQPLLDAVVKQLLGRQSGMNEQTLRTLTTVSVPALRAYLSGRAAYRQAHDAEAIRDFSRALELDSTFARAGLDLAVATLKILRQNTCTSNVCGFGTRLIGLRDITSLADEAQFDTGVRLAWQSQDRLRPRDRALLAALRGRHFPAPSTAREALMDFQAAARADPDRAETQYLLGILMLYQGAALDYSDWLQSSEKLFASALRLDSAYLAPVARLVDVSGYERDVEKLRRYGRLYLSHDSVGAMADFVRWRVAVGTGDEAALRMIHARFESLDLSTLKQIITASQMTGLALADADRASSLRIAQTVDAPERQLALYDGHMLALNRGRPHLADTLLRERAKGENSSYGFWQSATLAAIFGGSPEVFSNIAAARDAQLDLDMKGAPRGAPSREPGDARVARLVTQRAVWDYYRGDTATAAAAVDWLNTHKLTAYADIPAMLLATSERRSDAAAIRARVAALARNACCGLPVPVYVNLALARAYEQAGEDTSAFNALRREQSPFFLATSLKQQGEIAFRLKRYSEALEAFEKFLVFRSDPEPSLRAERDSVQRIVDALRRR